MVAVGSNNKILMQASYFRYDIDFVTNIEDTLHYVIMAGSITITSTQCQQ